MILKNKTSCYSIYFFFASSLPYPCAISTILVRKLYHMYAQVIFVKAQYTYLLRQLKKSNIYNIYNKKTPLPFSTGKNHT